MCIDIMQHEHCESESICQKTAKQCAWHIVCPKINKINKYVYTNIFNNTNTIQKEKQWLSSHTFMLSCLWDLSSSLNLAISFSCLHLISSISANLHFSFTSSFSFSDYRKNDLLKKVLN